MIVTTVTIFVQPGHERDFIEATVKNHAASVKEPGNLRFDFLQSKDDPSRFLLYEAYENEQAAKAHKQTAHYLEWRETVAPWMFKPREGVVHRVVEPSDIREW